MKRAVEQETLQTLVETGAAREFRVLRDGEGEVWRLELRLGSKWLPVLKTGPVRYWCSLTAVGLFCAGVGHQEMLTVEL